ncbi:hypothetical protein PEC301619_36300 [Pectobacterium carotovorum subsp. carotovorum]|nr:hypothetical protein PEC301619_36300 [Pectobacterium carotovorum subsp. carotovorum]
MGWLTREMSGQQQDGRLHATQTREYLYDGAGNLAGVRHNRETRGYRLDATGRVLSVLSGGAGRAVETDEAYRYTRNGLPQDTARLTEWQAGRLTQHDDTHYQYDKAGRLIRKQVVQPGYRPQVWHYRWDSRNQLRVVDTPTGERWFYRYDPFGRRTGKRCEQTQDDIRYLWDGDQIAEVRHYRNGALVSRRHWVHNGWELLVQQRQNADGRWETDFVTSSQNGEPQALYRPDGTLRWQAPKSTLWGQRQGSTEDPADPGLAFAGQYRDTESGLCYNRFRYYDPAGGCYVSPDPIGVLGGLNQYSYVRNPLACIDPLGLSSFDPFVHGEITDFPKDLHFGQNRIAPNFSNIGSQAADSIAGRPILDVAKDIKVGRISSDTFVISYTTDPITGKPVTLNNRGLAALVESGKFPQNAVHVPYEHVPKHLVEDIKNRPPSQSINITRNKDGSGFVKKVGKCG